MLRRYHSSFKFETEDIFMLEAKEKQETLKPHINKETLNKIKNKQEIS